eukprot:3559786-Amphidinium_carterae.1
MPPPNKKAKFSSPCALNMRSRVQKNNTSMSDTHATCKSTELRHLAAKARKTARSSVLLRTDNTDNNSLYHRTNRFLPMPLSCKGSCNVSPVALRPFWCLSHSREHTYFVMYSGPFPRHNAACADEHTMTTRDAVRRR